MKIATQSEVAAMKKLADAYQAFTPSLFGSPEESKTEIVLRLAAEQGFEVVELKMVDTPELREAREFSAWMREMDESY